ncbi:MAG TPA: hypothetical protein VNT26_10210 [Candidatus Sulfotelmatobacter sp.]|nr:hypothetical protein [Candidatus Sulfotelmatobacter sp.]
MHKHEELKELAAEIQSHLAKMKSILSPPQNAREKELAGILNVQQGDLTFIQELLEDLN